MKILRLLLGRRQRVVQFRQRVHGRRRRPPRARRDVFETPGAARVVDATVAPRRRGGRGRDAESDQRREEHYGEKQRDVKPHVT